MLVRDKKNATKVNIKQTDSKLAKKLVLKDGYVADDESRAIDHAVTELRMDSRDVQKALRIVTELFDKRTNNYTVADLMWLEKHDISLGAGMIVIYDSKKIIFGMTEKGKKFFNIMFGPGNSPQVISRRNTDGYALIKYETLANTIVS